MLSLSRRITRLSLLALLALAGTALAGTALAASSNHLLPLLIDLPGFTAAPAEGMALEQDGLSIHSANRNYTRGDQTLDVSLLAGTNALAQIQPSMPRETPEYRISVEQYDGFELRRYVDKRENGGALFVVLEPGEHKGAVLIVGYQGLDEASALALARRFDWAAMREAAHSLLH